MKLKSALIDSGLCWPATPSARGAQLLALLYQFERSERWDAATILAAQQTQLEPLFVHASNSTSFYAERLLEFNTIPQLGTADWRRIPLLTRADLLRRASAIRSTTLPDSHGRVRARRTSGSTGQTVTVLRTEVSQLYWQAIALREHLWLRRDATVPSAIIRAHNAPAPGPDGKKIQGWGIPYDTVWQCGVTWLLDLTTDVVDQAKWLQRTQPSYLLTYPTNLVALLNQPALRDVRLQQILCVGKTLTDQLKHKCFQQLNAPVVANYSSQEVGYIGVHCPACGQYHVQSESVFVEVLDDQGEPCEPGEVGRVVVTDLHNFAMPLIRYEIRDYAEVGTPCAVRPGFTSLRRILGRRRNMLVFPDGRRHWPLVGFSQFNEIAPILQYQFVQHSRDEIEVRLVADEKLTRAQVKKLNDIIQSALGYPFQLRFRQWPGALPKTKGGKFEEFVCLVT